MGGGLSPPFLSAQKIPCPPPPGLVTPRGVLETGVVVGLREGGGYRWVVINHRSCRRGIALKKRPGCRSRFGDLTGGGGAFYMK